LVAAGLVPGTGNTDASVSDVLVGAGVQACRQKAEGFDKLAGFGGGEAMLERDVEVPATAGGEVLHEADVGFNQKLPKQSTVCINNGLQCLGRVKVDAKGGYGAICAMDHDRGRPVRK
jgi:hypothetical protein